VHQDENTWTVVLSNFSCVSVPLAEENNNTNQLKEDVIRTCSSGFGVVTGTHARDKKWLLQLLRTYFSTLVNITNRLYGSHSRYLGRYPLLFFTLRTQCFGGSVSVERLHGIENHGINSLGSKVLTAMVMKCSTFWVINVCGPLKVKIPFGSILPASCWFLACIILRSWRWKTHVTSKGR
jgi:hypothetical protein